MAQHSAFSLTKAFVIGFLSVLPALTPTAARSIPREADGELAAPPAIAIKLSPDFSPTRKRQDASITGADLVESLVHKALPSLAKARSDVELKTLPLFDLSPEIIDKVVRDAEANDPTYKAPDFHAWFQVHLPETNTEVKSLLKTLASYPEVESCQPLGAAPTAPVVNPNDDPEFANQAYLKSPDRGINAEYAWGFPGGDGAGQYVVDIEAGWKLEHEDLVRAYRQHGFYSFG